MIDLTTPLGQVSFVSVDLETTGLDPLRDSIVEIGAVKVMGGQILDEWDTLVSIQRTIPWEARRVHGISNEMLVGKPAIEDALPLFLKFLEDGALVEHSWQAFDVLFLEHVHGSQFSSPYLNTCTLSRKLFPFHRKHNLDECCRRHNIANERKHRALSDARATAQLLLCLLEACSTTYPRLEDLMKVASVKR
jgi:DNA polymerase III epsilon subunit family exonuclease